MVQGPFLIVSGLGSENALTDFDLWLMPTLIGERGGLVSPDHRGEGKVGIPKGRSRERILYRQE